MKFFGLQELGGLAGLGPSDWVLEECHLANKSYSVFCASPPDCFRGTAVAIPTARMVDLHSVHVLSAGILVVLRNSKSREFVCTLHLPHSQRDDCMHVWAHQFDSLREFLHDIQSADSLLLACDLNYEFVHVSPQTQDYRGLLLQLFLRDFQLSSTLPQECTWSNTRGSSSRIDYVLFRVPEMLCYDERVHRDSAAILSSDHKACSAHISFLRVKKSRRAYVATKCGKWKLQVPSSVKACADLAAALKSRSDAVLTPQDWQGLASQCSVRHTPSRYRDPPHVLEIIAARRQATDREDQRALALEVVHARAVAKKEWRTRLLERAASGDFVAITYFRRRQSTQASRGLFAARMGVGTAGGVGLEGAFLCQVHPC